VYAQQLQGIVQSIEFNRPFQFIFPDGASIRRGAGSPVFTARIKTARALRDIVVRSSLGFGEAYVRGDIDVEGDLQEVALLGLRHATTS
jgi:cyclopropane-fatty-acyl-phospholipid synthase